jgi:predicted HNH restriction endonuclease
MLSAQALALCPDCHGMVHGPDGSFSEASIGMLQLTMLLR